MANIAFISTAHIHTKGFIENVIKATDGRKVAAVWDDMPERGQRYAEMAGAPFVADLSSVINDPSIDGFVICAENTRHLALLEQVMPAGKPVFCEKPLVTTDADLAVVKALHQKFPVPLFCGYFMPFESALQASRKVIDAGRLGKMTHVRFRNAHHAAYGRWFDSPDLQWFTDPALSGGGAMMDMGTHAVHVLRSMFGPVTKVSAFARNMSGNYPNVDDFGVIQMQFANGIFGTAEAAWVHTAGPGGLEAMGSEFALLQGKAGYALCKPGAEAEDLPVAPSLPTRMDRLVAIIRGEIPAADLKADLDAVFDSVAIMAAAYRSVSSGTWENVQG